MNREIFDFNDVSDVNVNSKAFITDGQNHLGQVAIGTISKMYMPDYTNIIETVIEQDAWGTNTISYTATEDCYVAGGVGSYSTSGGTPSKSNCYCIKIDGNIVGMVHTSSDNSSTNPINYFLKEGQTITISSGSSNMRIKAWLYAYGILG